MELYLLDEKNRREIVVDRFESLIWAERYSAFGDFELSIPTNIENRNIFAAGRRCVLNESERVMTVETTENSRDDQGRQMLNVKGRSLEVALDDRLARGTMGSLETTPKWLLSGLPAAIARHIYSEICVNGILNANDVMPGVFELYLGSTGRIPEPIEPINVELDPKTVYDAIKEICDAYDLGFMLIRNRDTNLLYFSVYTGKDRTALQTMNTPVIFAPGLDNLQNTTEFKSIAGAKNVAYVITKDSGKFVYGKDVSSGVRGFDRKVLIVKVDDIDEGLTSEQRSNYLIQRGREELAKYRNVEAFDGEISQNSQYKYGVDYGLGDLVEMRNEDGVTNQMMVTEQIFVSDGEGDRSYPTLSLYRYVQPGSWLAWDQQRVWEEMTTEEWGTMP